ncbi:hypothetical protein ACEZ3G_00140 [Maribacter algicola]|uniref:Uncharacterized protein n=1 Tax=Meishania litoralis TaxID=3434685 RepID=A0ACC7LEJ0_9FLAO
MYTTEKHAIDQDQKAQIHKGKALDYFYGTIKMLVYVDQERKRENDKNPL